MSRPQSMKRVGKDILSSAYWTQSSSHYAADIESAYHDHRLAVIRAMFPPTLGRILDFGCGDGVLFEELLARGASSITGIEPDLRLFEQALGRSAGKVMMERGGVERLAALPDASLDLVLALNVLTYLTDAEERQFYTEVRRLLVKGGQLIAMHSNALFDFFTFNRYTVDFFQEHFRTDIQSLLTRPTVPERHSYNIRENPLAYRFKLHHYGFTEVQQEFAHFHERPPLLTNIAPDDIEHQRYPSTLDWPAAERWRLMLQCSMFGSRSVKL